MTEWQSAKLGEVASIKHGWPFKSEYLTDQCTGRPIVVSIGNFKYTGGFRFDETQKRGYLGDYPDEYLLAAGDILLIMTCQTEGGEILGIPGIIPNDGMKYLHNQRLGKVVVKTPERVSQRFLYWYFLTKEFNLQLVGSASGTKIVHTAPMRIESCEISLPALSEQETIASVLSSIDDKIDLLHRQNKTLEAMAATLFRQWFVEEAGEDWDEVRLGDFFPVVTGKKDANFSTDDGEYPFFTCSQTAIKAPSYSFDGAAILLAGNGDFNVKRYIGKFEAYQRTYVLIPYDVKYFGFLFTLMRYYLSEITGGHQGSVINFITKGMITDFTFSMPNDRELISKKLEHFNEIYEKVDSNTNQIHTLERLRDTLLPKLMSGEVRVAY